MTRLRESEDAGAEGIAICAETAAALKSVGWCKRRPRLRGAARRMSAAEVIAAGRPLTPA